MEIQAHSNRLRSRLSSFRTAGGNVVMTFALAIVPIMGAVGAAVDYSRASNIRAQLHAAADAAAVGAVAKSSPAMAAAATMTKDGPIAAGETDALKIFNSQVTDKSSLYSSLSVTAAVAKTSGNVSRPCNLPPTFRR